MGNDGSKNKVSIEETVMNMKVKAKQLNRQAARCNKEAKMEEAKVKRALEKQDVHGAQIHAENAVRKKNEALSLLRFSSRIDGAASRLQTADSANKMSRELGDVVPKLDKIFNGEQAAQHTMDIAKFEEILDSIDVHSQFASDAITDTSATTAQDREATELLNKIGDECALDVSAMLVASGVPTGNPELEYDSYLMSDAYLDSAMPSPVSIGGAGTTMAGVGGMGGGGGGASMGMGGGRPPMLDSCVPQPRAGGYTGLTPERMMPDEQSIPPDERMAVLRQRMQDLYK